MVRMIRCSRWRHLPRVGASFSTTSRRCDDPWGKMASGQELQASAKQTKVDGKLGEEKEDALKRIKQLKDTIRESEHKLTGLQRMKYQEEEYDKAESFKQSTAMRNKQSNADVKIESDTIHSVQEIRRDVKYRLLRDIANLITSAGLCMVLYFAWVTFQKKVDEQNAAREAEAAGLQERNTVKDSMTGTETTEKASNESIFD